MSATAEDKDAIIAALRAENAALRERQAARDVAFDERAAHQAAMIDVLKAMSASPGDPQPVFDLIVQQVVTLLDTQSSMLLEYDGALLHFRADAGTADLLGRDVMDEFLRGYPLAPHRGIVSGRAILDAAVVHVRDLTADPDRSEAMRALPYRSQISVPLLRDGRPIGVLTSASPRVDSFSDAQVELLKTFAAQAVIAIISAETYRALQARTEELAARNTAFAERIDHQAATIDVLRSISASPEDARPALETIARRAWALCGEQSAIVYRVDGSMIHLVAYHRPNLTAEQHQEVQSFWPRPIVESVMAPAVTERRILHVRDVYAWPLATERAWRFWKSAIWVPMLRGDTVIGLIGIDSQETGGFSDTQVELLKTFAEQAVIAITSAETYRALQARTAELAERNTSFAEQIDHQAATIDVLKAMSASPGDARPALEMIARRAWALCGEQSAIVYSVDGPMMDLVLYHRPNLTTELAREIRSKFPSPFERNIMAPAITERRVLHIRDIDTYSWPGTNDAARRFFGSAIWVPMLRGDTVIGLIGIDSPEKGGFSDTQVELLKTFAEQAVIAITSAETYSALQTRTADLQESLEYQTATSDVLSTISRSTADAQPVLDQLVETAARLCDAEMAMITRCDDKVMWLGANHGYPAELWAHWMAQGPVPLDPMAVTVGMRTLTEGRVVHVHDVSAVPDYPVPHLALGGLRTILGVPLRNNDKTVGHIGLARARVAPFTARQVALLENFAAQAVIAMENARLLTEQREALEQQTATAEVLGVINASPGDLTPVFDAVLEKALRLCGASIGGIYSYNGRQFEPTAFRGVTPEFATFDPGKPLTPFLGGILDTVLRTRCPVQDPDLMDTDRYRNHNPYTRALVDLGGIRALLDMPLLKDGDVSGVITIFRDRPGAFTDKQIALLENFAAQAVIAMDNARLLTEQREALEQQTATAEVLQVINASPGDLAPVFEAMLDKAMRLCGVAFAMLRGYDSERFYPLASRGLPAAYAAFVSGQTASPGRGTAMARALETGCPMQEVDIREEEGYKNGSAGMRAIVELGGGRTVLHVPLVKDRVSIGFFTFFRQEVRAFSDKEIALLANFAAQAVIAMENARLLTETREALEQQTATAEVLRVINESPGDLGPVFDAILNKAHTLCGAAIGSLYTWDGEFVRAVATHGFPEDYAAFARQNHPPNFMIRPLIEGARYHHVPDVKALETRDRHASSIMEQTDARTILMIPLRKDGAFAGFITAVRTEVRPFVEKEIALLENFAAQAVIAMDNARLLTELRESLEQQTAMADVLRVINLNPGDVRPVFDAILARAHRIGKADRGALALYDDGVFRVQSTFGYSPETEAYLRAGVPTGPIYEPLFRGERVYIPDRENAAMPESGLADWLDSASREELFDYLRRAEISTYLLVPLYKDGTLLGLISANRHEARPFSEKEIALLENFAAQAVIAVDNARLLNEIRQRQVELDITFENMGDGVAMFDDEQKLAAWNRNFQDILDLPDDAVRVGLPFADYIRGLAERGEYGADADTDEQIARLTALLDQANRFERTRPNGHVIDVRQNPIPGGGFVVIYADITDRKRAEEALRAARDEAETALRELKLAQANLVQAEKMASLGQLTAGIAHEIKNPLNFVNNFASLSVELLDELKEAAAPALATLDGDARADVEDLTETLTGNLKKIEEHGKRADGIVRSMLEHSRGSSAERRAVDINDLVDEALNLAYHGARAQDQSFNITLERDLAPGIAPVTLAPQDMTRVLLNLIGNGFYAARKRRETGAADFEPTLKVATRDLGDTVEFRVRDNGIGIPPGIRDKLFQPFFTTKPTGEGTGLGLSITWDIVTKAHAGTITVDSEPGDHTEFTVTLPRHDAERARP